MSIQSQEITQIRLLVPKAWVQELDTLAKSRFLTRLGLIRFYLRCQMDQDLQQLSEMIEDRNDLTSAHRSIQRYLNDRKE
jgi:hypothetical protein